VIGWRIEGGDAVLSYDPFDQVRVAYTVSLLRPGAEAEYSQPTQAAPCDPRWRGAESYEASLLRLHDDPCAPRIQSANPGSQRRLSPSTRCAPRGAGRAAHVWTLRAAHTPGQAPPRPDPAPGIRRARQACVRCGWSLPGPGEPGGHGTGPSVCCVQHSLGEPGGPAPPCESGEQTRVPVVTTGPPDWHND
jgi:hypothetical protein